jgi:hypothetical protein
LQSNSKQYEGKRERYMAFCNVLNLSKGQNVCAMSRNDNILGCMADCLKLVEPRSKGECRPNLTYGNNYEFFVSFDVISGWKGIKFFLHRIKVAQDACNWMQNPP